MNLKQAVTICVPLCVEVAELHRAGGVLFLHPSSLVEDEFGLLQATVFENIYERYGWLLHHRGAFLLDGTVEQNPDKGFSFVVSRVRDLGEALAGAEVRAPKVVRASGGFVRASRRGRRRAG